MVIRRESMQISGFIQNETHFTVIMRVWGKRVSDHYWALHLALLCHRRPHLYSKYFFFYSVLLVFCIASEDVGHFNDFEQSFMSLLAWFSSFAMSYSKIVLFMCKHTRVRLLTHPQAYSLFSNLHVHSHKRHRH